jgi:DNA-directed RNA polymerase subunit N (RpoN/RPB10)
VPLYAQIFDSDLENHLGSGRTRALYSRYQRLLAEEPTELPHINAVCADDCLGLEDWSCRLMLLPDGDYLYTSYGRELAKLTGFTMLGSRISSGSGSAFGFFRQSYARAAASRRPLVTHSAAVFAAGIASWIRLVLPVRDDAGHLSLFTLSKPIY